jgi:hypothetical protein
MNTGDARNIDAIGTIATVTSVTTRLARVVERGGSRGARGFIGTAGDSGDSGDRERQRAGAEKHGRTCKERKALLTFPRHNGSRDGRRNQCRDCLLTGRYRPYVEPPELRNRRARRERKPKWRRSHRAALARYEERNPAATKAKRVFTAALKADRIAKPSHCPVRGCTSAKCLEAHHWNYAPEYRLELLWCCAAHHGQGHAQGLTIPADGISAHYGTIPEMTAAETETA